MCNTAQWSVVESLGCDCCGSRVPQLAILPRQLMRYWGNSVPCLAPVQLVISLEPISNHDICTININTSLNLLCRPESWIHMTWKAFLLFPNTSSYISSQFVKICVTCITCFTDAYNYHCVPILFSLCNKICQVSLSSACAVNIPAALPEARMWASGDFVAFCDV